MIQMKENNFSPLKKKRKLKITHFGANISPSHERKWLKAI